MSGMIRKGMPMVIALAFLAMILVFLSNNSYASTRIHKDIDFRNNTVLAEHGEWKEVPRFGTVWVPHVVGVWRPFLYGDWLWTDDGWLWDSYEPFGWMVYHYGNWYFEPEIGWFWIPGFTWSAAPVDWIEFGDFICWAPLAPAGFFFADPWEFQTVVIWNIVSIKDFDRDDISRVVLKTPLAKPKETTQIVRESPSVKEVETLTKQKIEQLHVNRQAVTMGSRTVEQIQIPEHISKRNEEHRQRVQREVLRPRAPMPPPEMKPKKH